MNSVLCVDWGAHGIGEAAQALAGLGYAPVVAGIAWEDIMNNPSFPDAFRDLLVNDPETARPSFVFTHNFFPSIAAACAETGIPYLSLVFDSPHMTLTSHAADCDTNHIWLFDRALCDHLIRQGRTRLHHTVLPASRRMAALTEAAQGPRYEHEVSFIGSLYQGTYIFYDEIGYMPPALKGFLDGVIEAQQQVFGCDMIADEKVLPKEKIAEMQKYVHFDIRGDYHPEEELLLKDMLRKKVTSLERYRVLEMLAKSFPVDVYTGPDQKTPDGVRNLGYADYEQQMPLVFYKSKINVNLTLRTIQTGIPLRAMDILASGGFLLSDYRPELAEFFRDGEEVVLARTPGEMAEKIEWYLAHDEERERVAANGQQAALERFGTERVFNRMIRELSGRGETNGD